MRRMAALRTLMMLIGALAVLTLGALTAAGPAEAAPPSCHGMDHQVPAGHGDHDGPAKAAMPMACCVACVTAVTPQPPIRAAAAPPAPTHDALKSLPLTGERPAPEPHPPRLTNA